MESLCSLPPHTSLTSITSVAASLPSSRNSIKPLKLARLPMAEAAVLKVSVSPPAFHSRLVTEKIEQKERMKP